MGIFSLIQGWVRLRGDTDGTMIGNDGDALKVTVVSGGSGGLTDAELRATPVDVTGPLTDTELRATAVPVSGPLTDTELRATAVPVSGPLTDTELRATPVPVSGTVTSTPVATTSGAPVGIIVTDTPVLIIAANANRKSIMISNLNDTAKLYLGIDGTVALAEDPASGILIQPGMAYVDSGDGIYTGDIYGIFDTAQTTEFVSVWERT